MFTRCACGPGRAELITVNMCTLGAFVGLGRSNGGVASSCDCHVPDIGWHRLPLASGGCYLLGYLPYTTEPVHRLLSSHVWIGTSSVTDWTYITHPTQFWHKSRVSRPLQPAHHRSPRFTDIVNFLATARRLTTWNHNELMYAWMVFLFGN